MTQLLDYLKGDEAELDEREFVAKKSANVILWIILGFFVVFILWAALTEIDRTVRGMGRVVPSSKLQVVSNMEGGVVEEILVKPGQTVKRGDIIVRLSPKISDAAFGSSTATVAALQAKVARLSAEVRGSSPNYGGVSSGQVAIEQSLHAARSAELQGLVAAGNARAAQAERSVAEARSLLEVRRSNLVAARSEVAMMRPLAEQEIVSRLDFIKSENGLNAAINEVAAAEATIARAQSGVAEA